METPAVQPARLSSKIKPEGKELEENEKTRREMKEKRWAGMPSHGGGKNVAN